MIHQNLDLLHIQTVKNMPRKIHTVVYYIIHPIRKMIIIFLQGKLMNVLINQEMKHMEGNCWVDGTFVSG